MLVHSGCRLFEGVCSSDVKQMSDRFKRENNQHQAFSILSIYNKVGCISCLKGGQKINFLPMLAIGLKFDEWVAGTKWIRTISQ